MSRRDDDTELDALSAQVRAFPPLTGPVVERLLQEAHRDPRGGAVERLVEHHLRCVLDAALLRRGGGLDLPDLFQEASIAATVAVTEYAARGGPAAGLRSYVERVVGSFLDTVVEQASQQMAADTLLLESLAILDGAQIRLRRELERPPTSLELAALLGWEPARVEVVEGLLTEARALYDVEILEYLDDA